MYIHVGWAEIQSTVHSNVAYIRMCKTPVVIIQMSGGGIREDVHIYIYISVYIIGGCGLRTVVRVCTRISS